MKKVLVILFLNLFSLICLFAIEDKKNNNTTDFKCNPVYLGGSKYKPVSQNYGKIKISQFSSEWKNICVFNMNNISEEDKALLEDVKNDGTDLYLSIKQEKYKIICGLFEDISGATGSFIAKLNLDETEVLQVLVLNKPRNKIFYIYDYYGKLYIVNRLYSSPSYWIDYDDFSKLNTFKYD